MPGASAPSGRGCSAPWGEAVAQQEAMMMLLTVVLLVAFILYLGKHVGPEDPED